MARSQTEAPADASAPPPRRGSHGRFAAVTLVSAAGLAALVAALRQPIAEALVRGWLRGKGLGGVVEISQLDFSGIKVEGLRLSQGGEETLSLAAASVLLDWENPLSPKIRAIELDRPVLHIDIGAGGLDLNGLEKFQQPPSGERTPPPPIRLRNGRIEISTPAGAIALDLDITGGGEKPLIVSGTAGRTALSFGEWRGDLAGSSFRAEITPDSTRGTIAAELGGAFAPGFRAEKGTLVGRFSVGDAGLDATGLLKLARFGQGDIEIRDLVVELRELGARRAPPATGGAKGGLTGWKARADIAASALHHAGGAYFQGVNGNLTLASRGEAMQRIDGQWVGRFGAFVPAGHAKGAMLPAFASRLGFVADGIGTSRPRADVEFAIDTEAQSAAMPVMAALDRAFALGLPEPLAGELRDWRKAAVAALGAGTQLRGRVRAETIGREKALRVSIAEPLVITAGSGLRATLENPASASAAPGDVQPFLVLNTGEFALAGTPALRVEGPDVPSLRLVATGLAIDSRQAQGAFGLTYTSRPGSDNQLSLQAGDVRLAWAAPMSGSADGSGSVTLRAARAQFSGEIYSVRLADADLALDGEVILGAGSWRFMPENGCLPVAAKAADAALVHVGAFSTRLCVGPGGLLQGGPGGAGGGFRIANLTAPLRLGAAEGQGDAPAVGSGSSLPGSPAPGPPLFDGVARIPALDLRFEARGAGVRTVILVPELRGEGVSSLDPRLRVRAGLSNINALATPDGQWRAIGASENIAMAGDKLAFRMADGAVKFDAAPLSAQQPDRVGVQLPLIAATIHDIAAPTNFAPVAVMGSGVLAGDDFSARFTPRSGSVGLGDVSLQADLAAGTGTAELHSGTLRFERGGLQPRALAPILAGQVNDAAGEVEVDFTFLWGPDSPATGSGEIVVRDFAFANLATGPITGLDTTLEFMDIFTLATAPAQQMTIGTINPGLPIEGVTIAYSIRPADPAAGIAQPTLLIESARIPVASGALTLQNAVTPLATPAVGDDPAAAPILRFPLIVEAIELQDLLDLMQIKDWKATGAISGSVPLEIQGTRTRIVNGMVSAENGVVRGDPATLDLLSSRPPDAIGPTGPRRYGFFGPRLPTERELAFQGLKDFTYERMSVGINGDLTGDLTLVLDLSGRGNALFDNLPLRYTMTNNFNVADIQKGFRVAEQISRGRTAKSIAEDFVRQSLSGEMNAKDVDKGVNAGP